MKKFTFWRTATVCEYHEVEAEDEEQARDMMCDTGDPVRTEWMGWDNDSFELEKVEEVEPLYRMVRDYKSVDTIEDRLYNSDTKQRSEHA